MCSSPESKHNRAKRGSVFLAERMNEHSHARIVKSFPDYLQFDEQKIGYTLIGKRERKKTKKKKKTIHETNWKCRSHDCRESKRKRKQKKTKKKRKKNGIKEETKEEESAVCRSIDVSRRTGRAITRKLDARAVRWLARWFITNIRFYYPPHYTLHIYPQQ